MSSVAKALGPTLLGILCVGLSGLTSGAWADPFGEVEIEESPSLALLAVEVPAGCAVEADENAESNTLALVFRGLTVDAPKRVHSGSGRTPLRTIDLEPLTMGEESATRFVVAYTPGSSVDVSRDGELVTVAVTAADAKTAPGAETPTNSRANTADSATTPAAAAAASTPPVPTPAAPAAASTPPASTPAAPAPAATPAASVPAPRETAPAPRETAPTPPAPEVRASKPSRPANEQPEVPSDAGRREGKVISIDLQGADIHTVLRSLSESSGRNIVANSNVVGQVTLKLSDVPWRIAMDVILSTQNLGYVEEGDIIRVATLADLRAEEIDRETAERKKDDLVAVQTEIVHVQFANAAELVQPLTTMLSRRGSIEVDARMNALVVTDIPTKLGQVRTMVKKLDERTPQIEIVAKLVDIDAGVVREMGINWGAMNLHSTPQAISGNVSVNAPITKSAGTINFGIIRDFADLDLTIQMLETENKANIISNPKITTVNNREARILVGQEIPLVVRDEAGNAITELKKIGIELRVTPHINESDLITLDLRPQVSDLASTASQSAGVIINTTEADTRVMVRDNETAVIGGLIRSNETRFESGVPVLKEIPLLGGLFRSSSVSDAKRELLIFVTPKIIS
jgi:type IV pilus assembly protein PilQ